MDDALLFGVLCCMWTVKGEIEPGGLGVEGGEVKDRGNGDTSYNVLCSRPRFGISYKAPASAPVERRKIIHLKVEITHSLFRG